MKSKLNPVSQRPTLEKSCKYSGIVPIASDVYKGLQAAALNPEVRSMLSLAINFNYLFSLTLKVKNGQ